MDLTFKPIQTTEEIRDLAQTANEIWHEYFPGIITMEQVNYMVSKFQAEKPLTQQIQEEGYLYYLVCKGTEILGYIGLHPEEEKMFLSKLYLKKAARGHGYASQMLEFIEDTARKKNLSSIYLTVNRYNAPTIAIYEKKSFRTVREQAADIGNGFVMDDYIMEKKLL